MVLGLRMCVQGTAVVGRGTQAPKEGISHTHRAFGTKVETPQICHVNPPHTLVRALSRSPRAHKHTIISYIHSKYICVQYIYSIRIEKPDNRSHTHTQRSKVTLLVSKQLDSDDGQESESFFEIGRRNASEYIWENDNRWQHVKCVERESHTDNTILVHTRGTFTAKPFV